MASLRNDKKTDQTTLEISHKETKFHLTTTSKLVGVVAILSIVGAFAFWVHKRATGTSGAVESKPKVTQRSTQKEADAVNGGTTEVKQSNYGNKGRNEVAIGEKRASPERVEQTTVGDGGTNRYEAR